MNVDDGKKSRAALKSYFVKNAIPTEGQFAQFIDSGLNQRDDGLVKSAGDPLSIEAAGDDTSFKKALNFYMRFADADPAWTVSLRPRATPGDPLTGRPGLSINDAAGNSRLSVDGATGRVGVGVVAPAEALDVAGRINAGGLTIGPWPANSAEYVFVGANSLDQSAGGNYALLQSVAGGGRGRTFLNSPLDIRFRIGNADRMVLVGDGQLSIGASDPAGFRLFLPGRTGVWQNALAILADRNIRGQDLLGLVRFGNDGDYQMLHKASGYFGRNMLGLHCETSDALGFYSTGWTPLLEVQGGTGNTFVRGRLEIGTSDLYFTDPNHNHTGLGNAAGHAAIENGASHGALMIIGRTVTTSPLRRVVKVWDYLEVQGDLLVTGRIGSMGKGPGPLVAGWGGGFRTWDIEAEGTIWARGGFQATNGAYGTAAHDLAENYYSNIPLEPGDVVSLDPEQDVIVPAGEANCTRVIGVISTEPGFLLNSRISHGDAPPDDRTGYPVALSGRVPCKVTDEGGPIRRGDLLTSASRPGYAMRAQTVGEAEMFRSGTIIGKALGSHSAGEGVIEIFVMLH